MLVLLNKSILLLKRQSITRKILLLVLVFLISLLALSSAAYYGFSHQIDLIKKLYSNQFVISKISIEVNSALAQARFKTFEMLKYVTLETDTKVIEDSLIEFNDLVKQGKTELLVFCPSIDPTETNIVNIVHQFNDALENAAVDEQKINLLYCKTIAYYIEKYQKEIEQIVPTLKLGTLVGKEISAGLLNGVDSTYVILEQYLKEFTERETTKSVHNFESSYLFHEKITRLFVAVSVIFIIISLLISYLIAKSIIAPISKSVLAMENIAGGKASLKSRLEVDGEHEIGKFSSSFNQFVEKIEELQDMLLESKKHEALGTLVAGVAHEINTPVGIALTATSMIGEEIKEFSKVLESNQVKRSYMLEFVQKMQESVNISVNNIHRAAELIKNFKKISVDQANESIQQVELNSYMNEVILSTKPALEQQNVEVLYQSNHDPIYLNTCPGALGQVFSNLIVNSLFHGYEGTKSGKITIQVEEHDNKITIIYKDYGKGMKENDRKHIFDPFFTTRRGEGGTGLGMHIVYRIIIDALYGDITCHSEYGHGITFTITLAKDLANISEYPPPKTID